jgi:hypothetical protein
MKTLKPLILLSLVALTGSAFAMGPRGMGQGQGA